MTDIGFYQRHLAYSAWATNRLLDACSSLTPSQLEHDFGTADKSIAGTLLHIFRSERLWLDRIRTGRGEFAQPSDLWTYIQQHWPSLHGEWSAFLATAPAGELDRAFEYHDLKGNPRNDIVGDAIVHMVNHGTHHRGQVSGFLRNLGLTPPPLDFIAFVRQRRTGS